MITFGVENSQPTQMHYYLNILTPPIPLYSIVYLSIVIGIIVGMIVGISRRFTLSKKVRSLQHETSELREKGMERPGEEEKGE